MHVLFPPHTRFFLELWKFAGCYPALVNIHESRSEKEAKKCCFIAQRDLHIPSQRWLWKREKYLFWEHLLGLRHLDSYLFRLYLVRMLSWPFRAVRVQVVFEILIVQVSCAYSSCTFCSQQLHLHDTSPRSREWNLGILDCWQIRVQEKKISPGLHSCLVLRHEWWSQPGDQFWQIMQF